MESILDQYYVDWERRGEMTDEVANGVAKELDVIMETGLSQIESLTIQGKPNEALAVTMNLTSLVNVAAAKQPKIIRKLNKWVGKMKSALQNLGQKSGADQISISVGVPVGVSIGLAWNI